MARARRAKPRRSRALIGLIVVALLAGGAVAALRFWPGSLTAIGPSPGPAGVSTPSAAEPSTATSPSPTASPSATESATAEPTPTARPASGGAVKAMEACRDRVRAADAVLAAAKTGIGHWDAHVAAQRDADRRDISPEEQQRIFKDTRLKGPADQKRYADAQRDYEEARKAFCGKAPGADAKVAATLSNCRTRVMALGPVMRAADAAMDDWKSHLAAMQRSREVHVDNAQAIWIAAYRAAPENLDAYDDAVEELDAPRC